MKRKRLCAALTAVACTAAMMSVMPMQGVQASALVQNDFEVTFGGWYAESPGQVADLTAAEGRGFDGSRALKIVGRTSPADGAVSEKDLYLAGGNRYDYSVRVSAETDQHFKLSIVTESTETGEKTVKVLDEKDVKGGEWATLSASYKAPSKSKSFKLTITTDTTDDFYFDDVTVIGKQGLVASAADKGLKDMLVNYGIRSGNLELLCQQFGESGGFSYAGERIARLRLKACHHHGHILIAAPRPLGGVINHILQLCRCLQSVINIPQACFGQRQFIS